MKLLTEADAHALTLYCQTWAQWRQAVDFLNTKGPVYAIYEDEPDKDGNRRVKYLQQAPQVSIARNCAEMLIKLEREFGFTPASRSRITVPADAGGKGKGENLEDRIFGAVPIIGRFASA